MSGDCRGGPLRWDTKSSCQSVTGPNRKACKKNPPRQAFLVFLPEKSDAKGITRGCLFFPLLVAILHGRIRKLLSRNFPREFPMKEVNFSTSEKLTNGENMSRVHSLLHETKPDAAKVKLWHGFSPAVH